MILDRAFDLVVLVGLLVVGIAAVADAAWLVELAAGGAFVVAVFLGILFLSRAYTKAPNAIAASAGSFAGSSRAHGRTAGGADRTPAASRLALPQRRSVGV